MNTFKNKKGFTLIELLAVVVVLAIISLLASQVILAYLQSARKNAFAIEANEAISAATDAVSLVELGVATTNYTKTSSGGYCFTLQNLKDLNLYKKDLDEGNYKGKVDVTIGSDGAYVYKVTMANDDYYVNNVASASEDNVSDASEITSVSFVCDSK